MNVSDGAGGRDAARKDGTELLGRTVVGGRTLEDICAEYVGRWHEICTDTRPVDRDRVRSLCAAINAHCHYGGMLNSSAALRPPLVLFFPSLEAIFLFWMALFSRDEGHRSWWRERCGPETAAAVEGALHTVARALGYARYRDMAAIRDRAEYLVYYSTGSTLDPGWWDLGRNAGREHNHTCTDRWGEYLQRPLGDDRVFRALVDRIKLPVVEAVSAAGFERYWPMGLSMLGGQYFFRLDGAWVSGTRLADLCVWELACEALGMEPPADGERVLYDLSCRLARESWIVYGFPGIVLVSERPVEMHLDDAGLPHRENGPAVRFADGTGFRLCHGVPVSEAMDRLGAGEWEPWMVLRETNTAVRRAMIARWGMDELLRRADAHVLAERGAYAVVSCVVGGLWGRHLYVVDRLRGTVFAADCLYNPCEVSSPPDILERFIAQYGDTTQNIVVGHQERPYGEWYTCVSAEDELL